MTVTDPWGMPISCAAEVAPTYGEALRRYHDQRSGDVERLQQVVEQDPGFAVGRATAAVWAAFGTRPSTPRPRSRPPSAAGPTTTGSGRFVAAARRDGRRGRWPAMPRRGWPTTTPTPAT